MCLYELMCTVLMQESGDQRECQTPPGIVSHSAWVLATEPRPSAGAIIVPNARPLALNSDTVIEVVYPVPKTYLYFHF